MGSTLSASLPQVSHPCALIQLTTWKGDARDRILMVPVAEEVFEHSCQHPLFTLLLSARNEPSVRHWYMGAAPTISAAARATQLEQEISAEGYYAELFGSSSAGTTTTTTRWMMISLPTAPGDHSEVLERFLQGVGKTSFLSFKEAVDLVLVCGSSLTASGYLECRHEESASNLRFWIKKTFSTEGRSLVLFQAAAFMEVRRMQLAKLRAVSPSALELEIKRGDVSTFRTLEWTVRSLLPERLLSHHQFISTRTNQTNGNWIVRVDVPALSEILQPLEATVQYPAYDQQTGVPSRWLSLIFDQRPVERILTPFNSCVEVAKEVWTHENAIVIQVQPNQRRKQQQPRKKLESESSETSSLKGASSFASQASNNSHDARSYPISPNQFEQKSPPRPLANNSSPYALPQDAPVHYFHPTHQAWQPLWYVDKGARLVVAKDQPFQQVGKLLLETEDSLVLLDEKEHLQTIHSSQQEGGKSYLVVPHQFPAGPVMATPAPVYVGMPKSQC